jgi:hypothetical protein
MIAHLTWRESSASACAIKEINFYTFFIVLLAFPLL